MIPSKSYNALPRRGFIPKPRVAQRTLGSWHQRWGSVTMELAGQTQDVAIAIEARLTVRRLAKPLVK